VETGGGIGGSHVDMSVVKRVTEDLKGGSGKVV